MELRGVKMSISDADISLLWGRAAGHCSYPGCAEDCSVYLKKTGHTILGEMAHVIARSAAGPRGAASVANRDGYENLILLCPTHHTLVDKAPADFPAEELTRWKAEHEARVSAALTAPIFSARKDLYDFAARLLSQNGLIHGQFGPESQAAKENPLSEGAVLWRLRKCDTVIPNNMRIVGAFERSATAVPINDWKIFEKFREHAFAFQQNTYNPVDGNAVPRFPPEFGEILQRL